MSDPERSLDNLPRSSLLHIPRQQRSARRVHDILDAGVRVLLAEGSQAFNTNRIADAADVPVGSVYQYFPHKQAILGGSSSGACWTPSSCSDRSPNRGLVGRSRRSWTKVCGPW